MEDIHLVKECPISGWTLFIVCDGHGGTAVVKKLESILCDRILSTLAKASMLHGGYRSTVRPSYLRQCMKSLIVSIDAELDRELKTEAARDTGSTLILMAYQPATRQIILVNVGDSRAVLSLPGKIRKITKRSSRQRITSQTIQKK